MGRKNRVILSFFLFVMIFLTGCGSEKEYQREFYAMDTVIDVQVTASNDQDAEAALSAVEAAYNNIDKISNRFASKLANPETSDVYRINAKAGIAPVKVSKDVLNMVTTSLKWGKMSGGAFNIVLGSIMDLWGFGTNHNSVPNDNKLKQTLTVCKLDNIIVDENESTVFLTQKGMVIDLGGIAKGYATDMAVNTLKELGIKNALINAGGNVYALGTNKEGKPWQVGVQHPRNTDGVLGIVSATDTAVISSGDYERYFEVNGVRYHHILNPATGYPSGGSVATTVICKSAAQADVFSTLCFVLGAQKAQEFFKQNMAGEQAALLIVSPNGYMYGSEYLPKYFSIVDGMGYKMAE